MQSPQSPTENDVQIMLLVVLGWIGIFVGVTVMSWAKQRRLAREAFYRRELQRHLVEKGAMTAEEWSRIDTDERRQDLARRRDRLRVIGLILVALGVGTLIALRGKESVPEFGWIPVLVGIAVLGHTQFSRPASP